MTTIKRKTTLFYFICILIFIVFNCFHRMINLTGSINNTELILARANELYFILKGNSRKDTLFKSKEILADKLFLKAFSLLPNGGRILIENGVYSIEKSIHLKSNISILGADTSAVVQKITKGSLIRGKAVQNTSIKNLKLISNHVNEGVGILLDGKSIKNRIDRVIIDGFRGDGINFNGRDCQNNEIRNCIIRNCLGAGIAIYGQAGNVEITNNKISKTQIHGVIISGGSNCLIKDNYIENTGFFRPNVSKKYFCHGIAIDGASGKKPCTDEVIVGNVILNSGSAGIEVADGVSNVTIRNNYVDGTGKKAPFDQYGIYFGGSYRSGTRAEIVNNTVKNCLWEGIRVDNNHGKGASTQFVRVDSNKVFNTVRDGIKIGFTKDVSVSSNEIRGSESNGIAVKGLSNMYAKKVTISNNIVLKSKLFGVYINFTDSISLKNNDLCRNLKGAFKIEKEAVRNINMEKNKCVQK